MPESQEVESMSFICPFSRRNVANSIWLDLEGNLRFRRNPRFLKSGRNKRNEKTPSINRNHGNDDDDDNDNDVTGCNHNHDNDDDDGNNDEEDVELNLKS